MTKRNVLLIVLTVLLVGFCLYLNRGWFVTEKLQITHRSGPPLRFARFGPQNNKQLVLPLFFELNRKLKLTSVKVIPLGELETNKYAHPVWELVPILRPVATKGFQYGGEIPGMKTSVPGAIAESLQPGVTYRLQLEAGSFKADYDCWTQRLREHRSSRQDLVFSF